METGRTVDPPAARCGQRIRLVSMETVPGHPPCDLLSGGEAGGFPGHRARGLGPVRGVRAHSRARLLVCDWRPVIISDEGG
jgi:hypothetical protein